MKKHLFLALIIVYVALYSFAGVEWIQTITTHGKGKWANSEIISHAGSVKNQNQNVSQGLF
jgi:hypothetical protein